VVAAVVTLAVAVADFPVVDIPAADFPVVGVLWALHLNGGVFLRAAVFLPKEETSHREAVLYKGKGVLRSEAMHLMQPGIVAT
jgi:hypothetical protein